MPMFPHVSILSKKLCTINCAENRSFLRFANAYYTSFGLCNSFSSTFVSPVSVPLRCVRNRCTSTSINSLNFNELLNAVGFSAEIRHYLSLYESNRSPAFAVVKVGGDIVEYELDNLVTTCTTLWNSGLMPVVIHGGGPQMNNELKNAGVEPKYIHGSRVTDLATLAIAKQVFAELNERVVRAINVTGTPAQAFPWGIFSAEIRSPELGFVGDINDVQEKKLLDCLFKKEIPVLASLGQSNNGQILNINADVAARELVLALKPMRVLFASSKGGWVDDVTNKTVKVVDIANDFERFAALDYSGRQGTLLKLNEIKSMLDEIPPSSTVHITSAGNMLKEIFTSQSTGTLFRKGDLVTRSKTIYAYPGGHAKAIFDTAGSKGNPGRLLNSFKCDIPGDRNGYSDCVWNALKQDYPSIAWCWDRADNDETNVLAHSDMHADCVLHGKRKNVAFYNQGHPLMGWNYSTAENLLINSEIVFDTASKANEQELRGKRKTNAFKVGLLGARGFVGREFLNLLCGHPQMELSLASSRAFNGQKVQECFSFDEGKAASTMGDLSFRTLNPSDLLDDSSAQDVDIWVLALPNGLAPHFQPILDQLASRRSHKKTVIIDLSADYRFSDQWVYGLPERPGARARLRGATRISNPGCYATGMQIALMPLLQPKTSSSNVMLMPGSIPNVFGVSGYSGTGTNPSPKNDLRVLQDNLIPYSLVNHIHELESSRHLGHKIAFMPHVASWFQGIHLTCSLNFDGIDTVDADMLFSSYHEYYNGEPLVKVLKETPSVKSNSLKHHVTVGGFAVDSAAKRIVVVSTIDNLLKGAATQAIQNLNIALDIDEFMGIPLDK